MTNDDPLPSVTPAEGDEAKEARHADPRRQFPCAQCGAGLEFDPGAAALTCRYCGHVHHLPQSPEELEELDFAAHIERTLDARDVEERMVVHCAACGAEWTLAKTLTADDCPFCATAVVATRTSRRTIKPRSLLPFKVTRETAAESWRRWLRGLWFAPTPIRRLARTERKLHGVYVPYWTYDCGALSAYRGERGDDYWDTQVVMVRQGKNLVPQTRRVRKTRWRPASGNVWNTFNDVLILASRSLPRSHTEKLEPWDLPALVTYKDEYLSGFEAESYQIDLAQGFDAAKVIMDEAIRRSICRDIGGDHQRIHSVKTRYDRVTFKHVLLPVWISAYRWREKLYRFVVNARTGEVQGERPWSVGKIVLTVLGALAAAGAVAAIANL